MAAFEPFESILCGGRFSMMPEAVEKACSPGYLLHVEQGKFFLYTKDEFASVVEWLDTGNASMRLRRFFMLRTVEMEDAEDLAEYLLAMCQRDGMECAGEDAVQVRFRAEQNHIEIRIMTGEEQSEP